jgi:hypothetical protein
VQERGLKNLNNGEVTESVPKKKKRLDRHGGHSTSVKCMVA